MLITYNLATSRFELVLQSGANWNAEMELAKSVGFKCDGPPSWTWATLRATVVNKLKQNRPTVLEITPQALEEFNKALPQEQENEKIIEQVKTLKKAQRKQEKREQHVAELVTSIPEYWKGKDEIGQEDLPQDVIDKCNKKTEFIIPVAPILKCQYCHEPVYYYEIQDPPTCVWCEVQLDKFKEETGL